MSIRLYDNREFFMDMEDSSQTDRVLPLAIHAHGLRGDRCRAVEPNAGASTKSY